MQNRLLTQAEDIIRQGGVVAVAFEHLFGLAADAANAKAVERVFEIKKRDQGSPVAVIIPSVYDMDRFVSSVPGEAWSLIDAWWPGPLTIVLRARQGLNERIAGESGMIGMRVPGSCDAARLCTDSGFALTATSANVSGSDAPVSTEDLMQSGIAEKVDLVIPADALDGQPSTVVEVTEKGVRLIRKGAIIV